jgi:hypothetical protein
MNHLSDSQLNEYLDHALPVEAHSIVDAHLVSCDSCRARLDELVLVFNHLADLPEVRISHDLTPGILSRLPLIRNRVWAPFFAAQVGAALGIIFWLSTKVVNLIKIPGISNFIFPEISLTSTNPLLTSVKAVSFTLNFLSTINKFQFTSTIPLKSLRYYFTLPNIPFHLDQLFIGQVPLSNSLLTIITLTALLICLFVNAIFLRSPVKANK